jgi:hypothetical protein
MSTPEIRRGRQLLTKLTAVTGYLRKDALAGQRSHIVDIAKNVSLTQDYVITLLTNALQSAYRDEQLELFCSQIYFCDKPADLQTETYPVAKSMNYPPLPILAALSGSPVEVLEHNHATPEGRKILEKYIELKWVPARKEWLEMLDRDLASSKLLEKMEEKFPAFPPVHLLALSGPIGSPGLRG